SGDGTRARAVDPLYGDALLAHDPADLLVLHVLGGLHDLLPAEALAGPQGTAAAHQPALHAVCDRRGRCAVRDLLRADGVPQRHAGVLARKPGMGVSRARPPLARPHAGLVRALDRDHLPWRAALDHPAK